MNYINDKKCRVLLTRHFFAKLFLLTLLGISPLMSVTSAENKEQKPRLGDFVCALTLYLGGTWLAYKQLPRMTGQKIEFNAPQFTKILASIFFGIGATGGVVGAYQLITILREKLNSVGKDVKS